MDSRLLSEYRAFLRIEPVGDSRGDFQAAIIAACAGRIGVEQCLPDWDQDLRVLTLAEKLHQAMAAAAETIRRREIETRNPKLE